MMRLWRVAKHKSLFYPEPGSSPFHSNPKVGPCEMHTYLDKFNISSDRITSTKYVYHCGIIYSILAVSIHSFNMVFIKKHLEIRMRRIPFSKEEKSSVEIALNSQVCSCSIPHACFSFCLIFFFCWTTLLDFQNEMLYEHLALYASKEKSR